MPRSFLVKKKAGVVGMPRPVSVHGAAAAAAEETGFEAGSPRAVVEMSPVTLSPLAGLPCPNIFSPAKLISSSSPVAMTAPHTPERCSSRASYSSSRSITPEPINYSMSSPRCSNNSLHGSAYSSPAGSPRLSPDHCQGTTASSQTTTTPVGSPTAAADLAHLPFLALSFQRLQEMHMKAVESRLQGITMSPPRSPPTSPSSVSAFSPVQSPVHHMGMPQPAHCHQPNYPTVNMAAMSPPRTSPPAAGTSARSPAADARGCDLSLSPVMPSNGHGLQPHQYHPASGAATSPFSWAAAAAAASGNHGNHIPMDTSSSSASATSSSPDLTTPIKKRKDNDPPRYQCEACNKSYATFSGLSKHKQFHCTALIKKEFVCKHCDKKYVSLGALKMHIRTHTLPCKCHICGKAFSRPWLLQGHVRTHTGEKPFPCNHCGRSFADRSNLRAHLQTHTDIKKYNCTACSKSFSRSSLLHKHMDNGCGATSAIVRSL